MNFDETVDYLFNIAPDFQKYGVAALNYSLEKVTTIAQEIGNPHIGQRFIHIAGTNGKGSVSHILASCLQEAGYKTGLYTSPHLFSFTERIKIDGLNVDKEFVVDFVATNRNLLEKYKPSFFEVTTLMAFEYFKNKQTDIAVIETGLGGRLDATNIISPLFSVITNIGFDHVNILGETLPLIAAEKAGIIKPNVPTVIGEYHPETLPVFHDFAKKQDSPLRLAFQSFELDAANWPKQAIIRSQNKDEFEFAFSPDLKGDYQKKNYLTAYQAIQLLNECGDFEIDDERISSGFEKVASNTKLRGRWQVIAHQPLAVLDTAHNLEGLKEVIGQASEICKPEHITWVLAFAKDKEYDKYITLFPRESNFFFCETQNGRLESASVLCELFTSSGFKAKVFSDVKSALSNALQITNEEGLVVTTGSNFHIAELGEGFLASFSTK